MMCENCGQRPANVHFTQILNGQKTEMHLCEHCARDRGEAELNQEPTLALHSFLAGLLNAEIAGQKLENHTMTKQPTCPACGWTYAHFSKAGRLGCSECYNYFSTNLQPLIRRIHGASQHTGKVPSRSGGLIRVRRQIGSLRDELQCLIQAEEFEKAAQVRDQIKELEKELER